MESYIDDKKNLYRLIHKFIEESDELDDVNAQNECFSKINIEGDAEEIRQILGIIKSIGEHHHRDQNFNERINKILLHYKDQIKQVLQNIEIFHIFENNKKLVHFLLKEGILTISDEVYKEMIYKTENNGKRYCHFFIPELEKFAGEEKMTFVKNELLNEDPTIFTNYEAKRQEGENDSYICSLIRQDSVEEFISYVNRYNISPFSQINPSIFETNPFLIDNKNTTLVEYSAFFGSIQIFQYFVMNNVELEPSLWLYSIHSNNPELIHLLETNRVPPPEIKNKIRFPYKFYEQCLIESIKCHHNEIAEYIEINLLDQNKIYLQLNEKIISNSIKYHNYLYFNVDAIVFNGFFYLNLYHYDKLLELLIEKKVKSFENKIVQYSDIKDAANNNEIEFIYHYLLKIQEITRSLFSGTKIKQIAIPSSVTSIGNFAFYGCSSLKKIVIPSSVTSIGYSAFYECQSLTQITIPFSVTSIRDSTFFRCSSLKQIIIPSSVTSIGNCVFSECSSLAQIVIPSSVASIGYSSFRGCSSLIQISIPSSITSIENYTFEGCLSLTQISIPSSVTSFGINLFKLIKKLEIAGDIRRIPNKLFYGCSSLTQIIIPSSVTSIGDYAFYECSSLTQITIPSSVTSIGDNAFKGCSFNI